jgi:hypothetical protein
LQLNRPHILEVRLVFVFFDFHQPILNRRHLNTWVVFDFRPILYFLDRFQTYVVAIFTDMFLVYVAEYNRAVIVAVFAAVIYTAMTRARFMVVAATGTVGTMGKIAHAASPLFVHLLFHVILQYPTSLAI